MFKAFFEIEKKSITTFSPSFFLLSLIFVVVPNGLLELLVSAKWATRSLDFVPNGLAPTYPSIHPPPRPARLTNAPAQLRTPNS